MGRARCVRDPRRRALHLGIFGFCNMFCMSTQTKIEGEIRDAKAAAYRGQLDAALTGAVQAVADLRSLEASLPLWKVGRLGSDWSNRNNLQLG